MRIVLVSILQGFPLLNQINGMILQIQEAGLLNFWQKHFFESRLATAAVSHCLLRIAVNINLDISSEKN